MTSEASAGGTRVAASAYRNILATHRFWTRGALVPWRGFAAIEAKIAL